MIYRGENGDDRLYYTEDVSEAIKFMLLFGGVLELAYVHGGFFVKLSH